MPEFFDAADAIWMPGRDGIKVGRNYQEQQNLRPWGRHLEGVAGFTKVNTGLDPFYEVEEPDASGDDGFHVECAAALNTAEVFAIIGGYGTDDMDVRVTTGGDTRVTTDGDTRTVVA